MNVGACDWQAIRAGLQSEGWALMAGLLASQECLQIAQSYDDDRNFRRQVIMARHGFGRGQYKYFSYPLPPPIDELRAVIYPELTSLANDWNERMKRDVRYPGQHAEFLQRCRQDGQSLPTPLLLKYAQGDYNCLHQDLYGEHVFPLQVAILLSRPGEDFAGGEFVLTEQRPRMQTRVSVVPLRQGDAVVFAVCQRPVHGSRGDYRVNQRHAVSQLLQGERFTLGIIFHDART